MSAALWFSVAREDFGLLCLFYWRWFRVGCLQSKNSLLTTTVCRVQAGSATIGLNILLMLTGTAVAGAARLRVAL